MLTLNMQVEMTTARRAAAYASFLALAFLSVAVGLSGNSAFAQRNRVEATGKSVLAEGLKDRVEVGKPDGMISGVIGNMNGSTPVESAGGEMIGTDGARTDQPATQDNKGYAESQRPNPFELIKQAPEFPIQIENRINAPLLITNARVKVMGDEENQVYSDGRVAENADNIISQFNITLVNQTDRLIKDVILEYKNPGLAGTGILIGLSGMPKNTIADSHKRVIEPHGSYILDKPMMIYQRRVLDGISDLATRFTIRVVGVKFESGTPWGDVTAPQEDTALTDFASIETVSSKPKILYKENPGYTPEARGNRVEGTVVLSVLFRSNGSVTDIKVVNGLPDGLTQNAIEAAKRVHFEAAVKDGRPVSVRGIVEFQFSVDQRQSDKNL